MVSEIKGRVTGETLNAKVSSVSRRQECSIESWRRVILVITAVMFPIVCIGCIPRSDKHEDISQQVLSVYYWDYDSMQLVEHEGLKPLITLVIDNDSTMRVFQRSISDTYSLSRDYITLNCHRLNRDESLIVKRVFSGRVRNREAPDQFLVLCRDTVLMKIGPREFFAFRSGMNRDRVNELVRCALPIIRDSVEYLMKYYPNPGAVSP